MWISLGSCLCSSFGIPEKKKRETNKKKKKTIFMLQLKLFQLGFNQILKTSQACPHLGKHGAGFNFITRVEIQEPMLRF